MVTLKAICGRVFETKEIDEKLAIHPEYVCARFCPEKSCDIYMNYFYSVTHHNDPR